MPDSLTPVSHVDLKIDVATSPLYKFGAEGTHVFKGDKIRINYDGYFYYFKDYFWGIGYDMDSNNANKSRYTRLQSEVTVDAVVNFADRFYVGALSRFSYINAMKVSRAELFDGQSRRTFTAGLGFTFLYDTRDVPFNAYRGVVVEFNQLFNPHFLANKYVFSQSILTVAFFNPLWKGAVLGAMVHADLTYGDTPWGLMPSFGGSERMRGYYEGRYRDKCEADVTVELRQHIWRRNGIVVWVGAGKVFPSLTDFNVHHVLPNYGIGYRWQFKPRVNIRLDIGFGRHEKGICFSINEAF